MVVRESIEAGYIYTHKDRRKVREHAHGGRWEQREFLCGFTTEFVPNFGREEIKRRCHHSEKAVNLLKQKEELEKQIEVLQQQRNNLINNLVNEGL